MREVEPLKLNVMRCLVDNDEEGELTFEVFPRYDLTEMELNWGPGPRRMKVYALDKDDMLSLHEWLGKVLELEE